MKVWLDDERPAPYGWHHVKTPWECIELLKRGDVTEISLDNDLGLFNYNPPNEGYHVANWIEKETLAGNLPQLKISIHTQNPVARDKMRIAVRNVIRYWINKEVNNEEMQTPH